MVVLLLVPQYDACLFTKNVRDSSMFHGSMVALVTPMHIDGKIDIDSFRKLIEMHIESGTSALIIAGTTGESATLTHQEKKQIIRHATEQVADRIPVIAGTNAENTDTAIELSKMAMDEGADACLIMAPAYIRPTQEGLFLHYQKIAQKVAIPIILYNVPKRTACDLLPETVARLAEIPNIIGIKEATGDVQRSRDILARCGEQLDVYSGDDIVARETILAGGKGVISVTANVAPRLMSAMCEAALKGDATLAEEIDRKLIALHQDLFLEANPIPVKWALHEMNLIPGGIRLPLTSLSAQYHDKVRNALRQAELL